MSAFHWTCPFCDRDTTVTDSDRATDSFQLHIGPSNNYRYCKYLFVVCPNPQCRRFTFSLTMHEHAYVQEKGGWVVGQLVEEWNLIPPSSAKVLPDYVPRAIRDDYLEACKIRGLSPKASATLSRRCLQGMIRDFWGVAKNRLVDEVDAIEDKVDADTWKAIDAVRAVGNIGAHMEKDINVIVDVEPDEAQMLIGFNRAARQGLVRHPS